MSIKAERRASDCQLFGETGKERGLQSRPWHCTTEKSLQEWAHHEAAGQ